MHHRRRLRRRLRRLQGGPWAWRGRFFRPGEVRLALLSLLQEGPLHGYELMKRLEERSGRAYRASAGTVYPTLQQLEDEGLAVSESHEGKRVYRLTPAGEREVEDQGPALRRIWRRAEDWEGLRFTWDPEAAEVARPALRLMRAAYRAAARADFDAERVDRVLEVLDRARRELQDLDS